jgi:hypothetical protein
MIMGTQIPVITEKPLAACGSKKFQQDTGDHLCTCTVHSGAKKAHDWSVDQIPDLFRTTHKVNPMTISGVVLNLILTDIYITLMI